MDLSDDNTSAVIAIVKSILATFGILPLGLLVVVSILAFRSPALYREYRIYRIKRLQIDIKREKSAAALNNSVVKNFKDKQLKKKNAGAKK